MGGDLKAQMLVGIFLFLAIAATALPLQLIHLLLPENGLPPLFMTALGWLQYAILAVDIVFLLAFILRNSWTFVKELSDVVRRSDD
jgi:hypothetical protein